MKPLLLIDVDGVLNPLDRQKPSKGWVQHLLGGYRVWLHPQHGEWLNGLSDCFELVWGTTWEDEANQFISPAIGLPQLPVVKFREEDFDIDNPRLATWKLSGVAEFVKDRPFAWIDDDLHADAKMWATKRPFPTFLLDVDPRMGLMEHHIVKLRAFAEGLGPNGS